MRNKLANGSYSTLEQFEVGVLFFGRRVFFYMHVPLRFSVCCGLETKPCPGFFQYLTIQWSINCGMPLIGGLT